VKLPSTGRIGVPDQNLQLVQAELANQVDRLGESPLSLGVHLKDVSLVAGSNTIAHKLGRTPEGYAITRVQGANGSTTITPAYNPEPAEIRQICCKDVNQTTGGIANTTTITLNKTPRDGSTLLMAFFGGAPTVAIGFNTPTQTGATWSAVNSAEQTAGLSCRLFTWRAENVASASTSITLTCASTGTIRGSVMVVEVVGVPSSSYDVASSTAYATATTYATTTAVTPTTSDSFVFIFSGTNTGTPITIGGYHVVAHPSDFIGGENVRMRALIDARRSDSAQGFAMGLMAGHITSTAAWRAALQPSVRTGNANDTMLSVIVLKADTTGGSSTSVTVPHGFRQTAVSDKFLTLDSIAACTVDMWVF